MASDAVRSVQRVSTKVQEILTFCRYCLRIKAAQTSTAKRHGFTLVELSVVLVIIGLIIGAVLLGRDLIKAAEIRAAISELANIQTALVMFEDKYKALPGDMSDATAYWPGVTSNGDGDWYFGGGGTDIAKNQEGGYLWHHLGLSGLYKTFKRPDKEEIAAKCAMELRATISSSQNIIISLPAR